MKIKTILCSILLIVVLLLILAIVFNWWKIWEQILSLSSPLTAPQYTAMNIFFTAMAFFAVLCTFLSQCRQTSIVKRQVQKSDVQNFKNQIYDMITRMVQQRNSLQQQQCQVTSSNYSGPIIPLPPLSGEAVSLSLLGQLSSSLQSYAELLRKENIEKAEESARASYFHVMESYVSISAMFFFTAKTIIDSSLLNGSEKTEIIRYSFYCLSKPDNQLLRIMLSHSDYKSTFAKLDYTRKTFGHEQVVQILSSMLERFEDAEQIAESYFENIVSKE